MTHKILAVLTLLLFVITPCFAALKKTTSDDGVRIGILSWRGPLGFEKRWEATEEYLTQAIDRPVTIIPLEFEGVLPAVKEGKVDFFTADPSMFMSAKKQYGASEVLTMKLNSADSVGAVLFTRSTNDQVHSLDDLSGKKFGALQRWSFGGWQMAEKEFRDTGIDPYPFLHTLRCNRSDPSHFFYAARGRGGTSSPWRRAVITSARYFHGQALRFLHVSITLASMANT